MMQPSPSTRSVKPAASPDVGRDTGVVAVHVLGTRVVQDGVQRRADAGQHAVLTDEIHEPHNGGTAGLLRGDGAGHDVGQQLSVLLRGPDIVLEVRIVEIPPPHVPHILARCVGRGGHTQRDQVRGALDFSKAQIALHGGREYRSGFAR